MHARVSRTFEFQSALHFEKSFIINTYNVELEMNVTTEDMYEQNIALDRMKYFFDLCLGNCIFVDSHDKSSIDMYLKAGLKVCNLPDEPYDQIIAAVLLNKLNSITEKNLFITEMKISSKLNDGVNFYISYEEIEDFINIPNTWWTENNTSISDVTKKNHKKEKIVELKKETTDWNSLGLGWELSNKKNGNEIVFTTEK